MRPQATPQANPVRPAIPANRRGQAATPTRRGDTHLSLVVTDDTAKAAALAQALASAPALTFAAAPDQLLDADELLGLMRRTATDHDGGIGFTTRDLERREHALRHAQAEAWDALQRAAVRFLAASPENAR